jgi:hypothetical protein
MIGCLAGGQGHDRSTGWQRRSKVAPSDSGRLRQSFSRVAMHGDELPLYSDPFIKRPEVGDLFPISMGARRGDLAAALVTRLTAAGTQHDHIHIEDSRWSEP